ncbi:MAG TPA: hypothetical protein VFS13_14130 [Steroidobacteraceae bacterium]|jgi:hypothetical protein|nr:hypothetical protein [Steroidobacteraceae bacterium]
MCNRNAAERLFWELVEDFGHWSGRQLALCHDAAPLLPAGAAAIAQTTTHLIKAATHANRREWEAAADACLDMAAAALNTLGHGEFTAAKDIIWDMAMAAHIAAGKDGAMFPEVQREVLHCLRESVGDRALAYLGPLSAA